MPDMQNEKFALNFGVSLLILLIMNENFNSAYKKYFLKSYSERFPNYIQSLLLPESCNHITILVSRLCLWKVELYLSLKGHWWSYNHYWLRQIHKQSLNSSLIRCVHFYTNIFRKGMNMSLWVKYQEDCVI